MVADAISGATVPLAGHGVDSAMLLGTKVIGMDGDAEDMGSTSAAVQERQLDGTYRGPGTPPPYDINRVAPSPDALAAQLAPDEEPWNAPATLGQSTPARSSTDSPYGSHTTPDGLSSSPISPAHSDEEATPLEVVSSDGHAEVAGPLAHDSQMPGVLDAPDSPGSSVMSRLPPQVPFDGVEPATAPSDESRGEDEPSRSQLGTSTGQLPSPRDADDDDFGTFADAEQRSERPLHAPSVTVPGDSHAAESVNSMDRQCSEQSATASASESTSADHGHPQGNTEGTRANTGSGPQGYELEEGHLGRGEHPEDPTGLPSLGEVRGQDESGPLSSPGISHALGKDRGAGANQVAGEDEGQPLTGQPHTDSSQGHAPSEGVPGAAGDAMPEADVDASSRAEGERLSEGTAGSDGASARLTDGTDVPGGTQEDVSGPHQLSSHAVDGDEEFSTFADAAEAADTAEDVALPTADTDDHPAPEADTDDDFADFTAGEEPLAGAPSPTDDDADSSDGFGGFEEANEGAPALAEPGFEPRTSPLSPLTPTAAGPPPCLTPSTPARTAQSPLDLLHLDDGELEGAVAKLVTALAGGDTVDAEVPCLDGLRARWNSTLEATVLTAKPEANPSVSSPTPAPNEGQVSWVSLVSTVRFLLLSVPDLG
jgi:hypothetical protein